jgi:hypothetical protein
MTKLEPGGRHTVAVDILARRAVADEKPFMLEFTDVPATEIIAPVEIAAASGSGG